VTLPAAERRVVTVLFGDLSDFTAWAESADPERVGAVTDRVLAALAGAVKTYGGTVDKLTGDGIMAVFGAPVAHEDDPERAVRAALAMQRAVRRVLDDERGGGAPSGLRIGVNTGEVVAGVQAALEYTVIGDTVNTAARLADAAAVGTVYAGTATSTATRHVVAWRRLLPLRLKGKRHAVEAYELLGPLDAPGTRSGLGDEGPFVGREPEMALVASRLDEAIDRAESRVLVFTAEAGLGKTRLAGELGRFAAGFGEGARVLSVRCAAYGERWRLGPLADLVRAALGLPDRSGSRAVVEERLRRVAHMVERRTGAPPRLQPEPLLNLLGYADVRRDTRVERGADESDADTVPAAVAELLSALATEGPLVLIVDDLHDANPPTVDALGAMLSRLSGSILVVLFGRPEMARAAGALNRLADAEVYPLPPLRGAEAARLLTAYLGGGRLTTIDTDRLLATAQGNPFYLAELVTLLMERRTLRKEADGWRLAPQSLSGRLLSRDLAAVLAARIDALPVESRALLRDAAVVGDTVPLAALEALQPTDEDRAVDELLHRRMLLPTRYGYLFATPLLREAAYAGVGKADLAERHARLVRWAAELTLPVPSLGWTQETLDAFVADQAERAAAMADAVSLRPDAGARDAAPYGVAALARLASRAIRSGEPRQAADLVERAARLGGGRIAPADRLVHASAMLQLGRADDALTDTELATAEADGDAEVRVRALILGGRARRMGGDGDAADAMWQDAVRVAEEAGLAVERAEVLRRIGMEDYLRGRLREAQENYTEALALSECAGDRRGQAWALQNLAWVTTTLGDFAAADVTLGRAARLFAALGDASGRAWLRGTTAFARLLAGRLHEARRLANAFLPFGERVGERWAVGTLRAVAAYAAAEVGELGTADQEARRAYREFDAINDDWGRGFALVVRGVVARGLGETTHAIDLLTDAVRLGEVTGHPLLIGMAATARGFALLEAGEPVAAETDAHAALAVVKSHDAVDAARVAPRVLLGRAQLANGDPAAALVALGEAATADAPAVLMSHRYAVAGYASALLAAGRVDEAVATAECATKIEAEDVRSRVFSEVVRARALAAAGRNDEADDAAAEATREAYATQQRGDRASADALRPAPTGGWRTVQA
jgi:class 3 adenylate cyclase/tetratricopeptide (TPR) repeat protein